MGAPMKMLTVLIVDDEPGMGMGASRVLSGTVVSVADLDVTVGFITEVAATGRQALERLSRGDVDLLLLDYKLPDITGLDVLDALRVKGIDVMTIMITAYASLEVAISATKNGAFDFLAKPFTPDELRSSVRKASIHLMAGRRARELEKEKRQVRFEFISVLAHELKSPLAAVDGYLRLLEDMVPETGGDTQHHVISRALFRLDSMRDLIFDLLDMTRVESGERERRLEPVDVVSLAKNSLESFEASAGTRGIVMTLSAPDRLLFHADESELQIVLNNLLSNAVKYNRENGRVELTLEMEDGALSVQVRDTGMGIPVEDQHRLFKEFSRIKNEHTRNIIGTGLGLSIVKRIAKRYQGEVTVSSEPGVGTIFCVTLQTGE